MTKWTYEKLAHALQKVEDCSDMGDSHEESQRKRHYVWANCGWTEEAYYAEQQRRLDDEFDKLSDAEKQAVLDEEAAYMKAIGEGEG